MRALRTLVSLTLFGLVGCGGGSDESRIALVPVTGTVTLNGKPMAGATVMFVPDQSNKDSTPGNDATGPEGNYKLMFKGRSGVAPGKYKVIITPAIEVASDTPDQFKDDPYMAQLGAAAAPKAKKKSDLTKSEFDAEVGPSGDTLDFDVKGKASGDASKS